MQGEIGIKRATVLLVALLLPWPDAAGAKPAPAEAAASFDTLKSLVGTWRATRPGGRTIEIVYRLTAGGTALAETWTLGPTRESMTVYHRDGPALLATHYCPIGNQPRLRMTTVDPRHMRFAFRDATDVEDASESHLRDFAIDLIGDDRIVRSETYIAGTKPETDTLVFDRVKS